MALNQKQLINITDQHKEWIKAVVASAVEAGQETNQTDIIRALLDQAMVQDPEQFVQHLVKMKVKARLDDIARREKALLEEKEQLTNALQNDGQLSAARH